MSDELRFEQVKEDYGNIAKVELIKPPSSSCCEPADDKGVLSLGCYSHLVEKAEIKEGEIVLDLGSGPGHDLIRAAEVTGPTGRAIGLDMTDEMLELGRQNTVHLENIEIIRGNLQNIPLDDNTVDVIISNCVFNLTPDKAKAFREAHRVLKPGGRIIESDIALDHELSEEAKGIQKVYTGCIAGAISIKGYVDNMASAGFEHIKAETQFDGKYKISGKDYEYKSVLFSGIKKTE